MPDPARDFAPGCLAGTSAGGEGTSWVAHRIETVTPAATWMPVGQRPLCAIAK